MMTMAEFCKRMGWRYPLPTPGTVEAEEWLKDILAEGRKVVEKWKAEDAAR
jgi:hypothetical protein